MVYLLFMIAFTRAGNVYFSLLQKMPTIRRARLPTDYSRKRPQMSNKLKLLVRNVWYNWEH